MSDDEAPSGGGESADDWTDFEDELDVAGMSVGEYRRLRERVEADGRESLSDEERKRYDAADAEMTASIRKVQDVVAKHWKSPPIVEDLRRQIAAASTIDYTALHESIARVGLSPAARLGKEALEQLEREQAKQASKLVRDSVARPELRSGPGSASPHSVVPQVDDSVFDGLAEAQEEARAEEAAHRAAELEALAGIAAAVQSTEAQINELRQESAKAADSSWSVAWWGVGLMGLTLIVSTAALLIAW